MGGRPPLHPCQFARAETAEGGAGCAEDALRMRGDGPVRPAHMTAWRGSGYMSCTYTYMHSNQGSQTPHLDHPTARARSQ